MLNKTIMVLLGLSVPASLWYIFIFTIFSNNGKHGGLIWCMVLIGLLYPILAIYTIKKISQTASLKWLLICIVLSAIIIFAFHKLSAHIISLR